MFPTKKSNRHPEYPQDLILRLNSGLHRIHKVEILSHHYKIASQIELYVGITKEQEQDAMYIQFTRLGWVVVYILASVEMLVLILNLFLSLVS